jgi:hypothetical protein
MKDVLRLFTFAVGALCFVVFVAVFKPDAVSAVPGASKPGYCKAEAWPKDGCRQQVFAAVSGHNSPTPLAAPGATARVEQLTTAPDSVRPQSNQPGSEILLSLARQPARHVRGRVKHPGICTIPGASDTRRAWEVARGESGCTAVNELEKS